MMALLSLIFEEASKRIELVFRWSFRWAYWFWTWLTINVFDRFGLDLDSVELEDVKNIILILVGLANLLHVSIDIIFKIRKQRTNGETEQ